jgi:pyruvate dehydrogenase E2 component (dihydrolipoamide acetyltransferase)
MAGKVSDNPNEFLLPDLGEGLEEAELLEWCVQVGQSVNEFDILAKMETDKALVEVPSPRAGKIAQLHGEPGQFIKVGAPLVTYDSTNGSPTSAGLATSVASDSPAHPARPALPEIEQEEEDAGTVVGSLSATPGISSEPGKVRAAPAVRRLARDLGVDIESVRGTGIAGRVTSKDVQSAAASTGASAGAIAETKISTTATAPRRVTPSRVAPPPERHAAPGKPGEVTRIPFRGVRRTIADRLRHSVNQAVHFNVMDEADVTRLDELRRRLVAASGEKLSLLPFVAQAICRVLSGAEGEQFAKLNATVDDEHQEIVQHRSVNLGIATDTESGLMVPVIRDAQKLGVLELAREIARVAKAARDRSIPRDELAGSTITISNVGSYAGRFATPIINYPEVAILAAGRAREGVVVRDGMMGVGKLLPLSLAADHRVVDGATAAVALNRIIQLLQDPDELLPPARANDE